MRKSTYWCLLAEEVRGLASAELETEFVAHAQAVEAEDADTAAEKFAMSTTSCPGEATVVDVAIATVRSGADMGKIRVTFSLRLHTTTEMLP